MTPHWPGRFFFPLYASSMVIRSEIHFALESNVELANAAICHARERGHPVSA
jgi:hypothetical protein